MAAGREGTLLSRRGQKTDVARADGRLDFRQIRSARALPDTGTSCRFSRFSQSVRGDSGWTALSRGHGAGGPLFTADHRRSRLGRRAQTMSIAAGTKLGPYEILAPLGAGGMGEVYRARDTRLERTVAVKVLPAHLSSSAEVRQRFEREAKTISQLSHPHNCALYDVGNQDGVEFLVMEYLEEETLAERLVKGPLPLEQ